MKNAVEKLRGMYRLYGEKTASLEVACRKYCADCCTTNVAMPRVEGLLILEAVSESHIEAVLSEAAFAAWPRYQPAMSTNAFAESCRTGRDAHEGSPDNFADDAPDGQSGECPFLGDDACRIYPFRPFGCRCMISETTCRHLGYAEMDEFTLSLNTVFLQFIEHLDTAGFYGNMIDVLTYLTTEKHRIPETCRVTPNRPIPALMVPPEHRRGIQPVLADLHRLTAAG